MNDLLSISGSTILSDEKLFQEILDSPFERVEIGEFKDLKTFYNFMSECMKLGKKVSIHSPIVRGNSKYDLINKIDYLPNQAYSQIEDEAKILKQLKAEYFLVHFPYFEEEQDNHHEFIMDGVRKLYAIQKKHSIQIVLEPKLGKHRTSYGIDYFHEFSCEILDEYPLGVCIDIGDYIMAKGENSLEYIKKWKDYIKVAHIHDISFNEKNYYWTPINPNATYKMSDKVKDAVLYLAEMNSRIIFVFEHTPHIKIKDEYKELGYEWLNKLLDDKGK